MNELKSCPFCGGEAQVNTWTMHGITESRCFCSNSDCPNSVRTVALEHWNTRPIEDALNARIAELEEENKKAFDFVKTLRTYCIYAHWDNPDTEGEFNELDAEICKWLSEFTERER